MNQKIPPMKKIWIEGKEALVTTCLALLRQLQGALPVDFLQPSFAGIGSVENKVVNGCVTHGNMLNSSSLKDPNFRALVSHSRSF